MEQEFDWISLRSILLGTSTRRPEQGAESASKGVIIMTNCESKVGLGSWD